MFISATRKKYRYPYKGQITTEDLWDLSIEELNKVYIALSKQLAEESENKGLGAIFTDALCNPKSDTQNKMDIVRYIAEQKHYEKIELEKEHANRARRKEIMDILEAKRNAELMNKTPEELEAMLGQL